MSQPWHFHYEGRVYMVMSCGRSAIWRSKLIARFSLTAQNPQATPAHFIRFARSRSSDGHNIQYLMVRWRGVRLPEVIMITTRPKDFYTETAAATVALLHGVTKGNDTWMTR